MCNCIPVIVQEQVFQAYEDLLEYESFSVRLTNQDLPMLRGGGARAGGWGALGRVGGCKLHRLACKQGAAWPLDAAQPLHAPCAAEILRNISDAQYCGMMQQLIKYRGAFNWFTESGGRAFDFTIASLRRRYQNLKALLY